ncbi:helicase-related protein [Bradyrhizobium brasilense]|uniref:helicase-related protein n=1 Tax=Bradyrhizobium brasilense TaxID=1419277 RepID=UPI0024B14448|nr:helicase-related protein [Bradyrhizobium australafricanum]WFU31427.1 helicase-related protein [Bradyrhizobium australafricanum]
MSALSPREILVDRLETDLVGPRVPDEILESKPADVYVSGILWPKNTPIAPEEDEKLDASAGGEDDGAESADQAQARAVAMRRPSTAGISFAVSAGAGADPSVSVSIRFATYAEADGKWKRVQHVLDNVPVALREGNASQSLVSGSVTWLRLHVRSVPFGHGWLCTITLVNDGTPAEPTRTAIEKVTLFQVGFEVRPAGATRLISRPSRRSPVDDDDWSSDLLYRDAREFAAGHTCSADWTESAEDRTVALAVRTTWLPQAIVPAVSPDGHEVFRSLAARDADVLSAAWLATADTPRLHAALQKLCTAYGDWIELQAAGAAGLTGRRAETARAHLETAAGIRARMVKGADFLKTDADAADAFRLANLVMDTQRKWSGNGTLRWRPFQLGFLLLTLESAAKGDHPDRGIMDLLWFPTGGGKTEAYLGLIAFVAFYRRLSSKKPDDGAGVAVIMRYTLRLLTTQQFIRASAMICACEAARRGAIPTSLASRLGNEPFSIGLWVGEGATPNRRQAAFDSQRDSSKSSPRQLASCPACGKGLNYVQHRPTDPVHVICETKGCLLSGPLPLPVWTVDQDIYEFRPTLLIGTVDKFAQIVRQEATANLFAVRSGMQPQLILQDELHLISGPLGTLSGLYESALDLILSTNGTCPKIVGSTATIRRASEQVLALFDRRTCQFPPPGLDAGDSGFTVTDPKLAGRRYVGVTTAGRSVKFTLQAVTASLMQSALAGLEPAERDHYWTLVAYFNSLRELGGALVLMQDDVYDTIGLISSARGGEAGRRLKTVEELTSRRSQKDIRDMLDELKRRAGDDAAIDVVLATNMVSVGVDIERLGLMVVNGQPKTIAEYIQATSRVGRGNIPGLVVTVLNNGKPRDRSHFETFRSSHATLYREVEATSVTPFASRARDRALHAVLVAVIRHIVPGMMPRPVLDDAAVATAEDLIERIAERASRVDRRETAVGDELRRRLQMWIRRSPREYWNRFAKDSLLQGAEEAAARRASGRSEGQAWPTPNTMRGVEPSVHYRLAEWLKARTDGA